MITVDYWRFLGWLGHVSIREPPGKIKKKSGSIIDYNHHQAGSECRLTGDFESNWERRYPNTMAVYSLPFFLMLF